MFDGGGRCDVENVNNHEKNLSPICRRDASLKEKIIDSVVDCTNHISKPPNLLGNVGTKTTHLDVIGGTKIMKLSIIILTPIVTFKLFSITLKLISNIRSKFKFFSNTSLCLIGNTHI